jgi:hypothetical protein
MSHTSSGRPGALPTFFVIGAPKAGTTSLHHYLETHPEIQMSAVKEPSYFARARTGPGDNRRIKDLAHYEALFDADRPVRGEASPNYAMYPLRQGVPERIRQLVPDAKLIYLVRDPIDRTVSHYHQMVATEGETRTLDAVLADLGDPRSACVCASMYALQLEMYLRNFPAENVLVVDQHDLLADRRTTLSRIFGFLGVDRSFDSQAFDAEFLKSEGRRAYPPVLSRFVGHTIRPRVQRLPPAFRGSLRRTVERLFLPPLELAKPDGELSGRLSELYQGEALRLRSLTGQMFPSWSV